MAISGFESRFGCSAISGLVCLGGPEEQTVVTVDGHVSCLNRIALRFTKHNVLQKVSNAQKRGRDVAQYSKLKQGALRVSHSETVFLKDVVQPKKILCLTP
jgi:hypothetical protein